MRLAAAILLAAAGGAFAQAPPRPAFDAFEVAVIKPAVQEPGRFIKMQSAHRFYAKGHTLKTLICAAYNVTPAAISGGPPWIDSERYDILAGTPGEVRPNLDEQMSMLRTLLTDRFKLSFERPRKIMSVYTLTVAKDGAKLKESTAPPDALPELINVVYPDHITLPARNATMAQFASLLQRGVLDRPVLDQTGLPGRYDFDLEWTQDESQFGGLLPRVERTDTSKPGLYTAMQEQLGLKLQPAKGPVDTIAVLRAEHPSEN